MDIFHQTVLRPAAPTGAAAWSSSSIALALGGNGVVSAEGWARCPCPAHNGTRPSLSLKLEGPQKLRVRCFSRRCPSLSVLRAIDQQLGTRFAAARAAEGFTAIVPEPPPANARNTETC
jgi:hypothetical protein